MKLPIPEIVRLLREDAEDGVEALAPPHDDPKETLSWEAADLIEDLVRLIRRFISGDQTAKDDAVKALHNRERIVSGLAEIARRPDQNG